MSSPGRVVLGRLRRDRSATIGAATIVGLCAVAVLAPWIAPYGFAAQPDIVELKYQPPSTRFLFGTDQFSRDVFTRVLFGARVSLSVALLSVAIAMSVGTAYGAVSGFLGGRADSLMMRVNDALLSIPRVLILLAVLSLWGRITIPFLVVLLGLTGWFSVSRIVRAQVMAARERDFVLAARALGVRRRRLLVRHVVPNVLSPVIVAATLGVGHVIVLEAGLSYLGIGVPQPGASWGNIIQDGAEHIATYWWIAFFPGLAIVLTVMAFNILGDALRDALDPRQVDVR